MGKNFKIVFGPFFFFFNGSLETLEIKNREMLRLQQFYNIFTTNLKWQVVIGCYCWVKKVISILNSNLNQ